METTPLALPEVKLVRPRRFDDPRGSFAEIANPGLLAALRLEHPFVQDNWSRSERRGTVRALHFQRPPNPQGKLVRVTRGRILDVAVDVRAGSPTFGRHVAVELSADRLELLWIPGGFAHGFVTRADATEITYKVTHPYDRAAEQGLAWDDPALGIDWGVSPEEAVLHERDRRQPRLSEIEPFRG